MPKRVLLTGCAGSIAYHTIVHIFKNTDWEIVGIESFRHRGMADRLVELRGSHPEWNDRLTVITHDLAAPFSDLTKKKIGHIDYVISMASLSDVEASIHEPEHFIKNNIALVLNTLEFAREAKPQMFLQFSTDEVFGPSEDRYRYKEWDPIVPSNPYAASKACQEAICISYWRTYNVPLVITNTVNNFGEMQSSSKFPVIVQKKIAAGETVPIHGKEGDLGTRYYIHSRNASDALVFILKNVKPYIHVPNAVDKPDRFNITSDDVLDNLQMAQKIAGFMGKELSYEFVDHHTTRPGHDKHYSLDGSKLKELGWKMPLSFDESMRNTVEWQSENPDWIK